MNIPTIPIHRLSSDFIAQGKDIRKQLDQARWDASVFNLAIQRRSSHLLKGTWHGTKLVAVRPFENWILSANIGFLWIDTRDSGSRVRGVFLGNIFVVLLFLVVLLEWAMVGERIFGTLLADAPAQLSHALRLDNLARSPLMHALVATLFYALLYFNFVWRGLQAWKKVLHDITQ